MKTLLWILGLGAALGLAVSFRRQKSAPGKPGGYSAPSDQVSRYKPVVFDGHTFTSPPTISWAKAEYDASEAAQRFAEATVAWEAVNGKP